MLTKRIVTLLVLVIVTGMAGSANAESYVVLAKGNKFSARMGAEIEAVGGHIASLLPQIGVALVEADADFASNATGISGLQSVAADVLLQFVDEFTAVQQLSDSDIGSSGADDGSYPTDSFGYLQWNMDAIDAPEAHAAGIRGAGARVAILDNGIDSSHVDLAANLNVGLSTSFVRNEGFDSPPGWHGTHVAGIVAAGLNGFGVVGVAPDAELVSIKVISARNGRGSFGAMISGIVYAADIEADVINISLGVPGGLARNNPRYATLINATQRAITYAYQSGTTVVAAAGNDARDMDHDASVISFPGGLANVLIISATAPFGWAVAPVGANLDNRASYSNYGQSSVDFAAPGGDYMYPRNETCSFGIACWILDLQLSTVPGNRYSWNAGTSMAAPHVAGVAALIIGANGGEMHPAQVRAALMASSNDLGKPGRDDTFGHGRVNALNAGH